MDPDNARKRRQPDDDRQDAKRSRYEEVVTSLDLESINWSRDEPREGDTPWVELHDVDWSQSFTQETAEDGGLDIEWSQLTPFTQEVLGDEDVFRAINRSPMRAGETDTVVSTGRRRDESQDTSEGEWLTHKKGQDISKEACYIWVLLRCVGWNVWTESPIEEYQDVFIGLGRLPGECHLEVDDAVTPVVHPPRRVPVAMKDQLRIELDKMTEEATTHRRQLKTSSPLKKAKVFSVLGAKSGYWQVVLDEESSLLTTFNTPSGRYKWKRLPFGIKSSPEDLTKHWKLSDISERLRNLIVKDNEFEWTETHEKILETLKKMVSNALVLQYYDHDEDLTLLTDASSTGVGAAITQGGQPVAYASRALTDTETRYVQIEKEMQSVVVGLKCFHQYTYSRQVCIQTDHKPLEMIALKPLHAAPKRLQRMLMRLQQYYVKITYKPGKEMFLADTLSRAYLPLEGSRSTTEREA
ncbi:hypothetical protein Bbelb_110960 [Branchiostoma belcheri]|nr:hypothetical protein Bbelb_110960 [Branchiostoma belcheri]